MTFDYNLSHSDATKVLISKVRFEIGDTVLDTGPRPNGTNFSNEEVEYWLDAESDHTMRASAAGLETLARQWSLVPNTRLGPHGETASQIAEAYAKRAAELRSQYGYGNTTKAGGFAIGTLPSDPSVTTGEYSV